MTALDPAALAEIQAKLRANNKIWLEWEEKNVIGKGVARLLAEIRDTQSLKDAASRCKYSYKYAWNILRRIRKRTGLDPVETHKGGRGGGGQAKLTPWGTLLLQVYEGLEDLATNFQASCQRVVDQALADRGRE